MTSEYKGWDNYVRSKIISCGSIGMCKKYPNMRHEFYDECDKAKEHFDTVSKANQYLKIKEEWKGAVDEYFGVEKTNDNSFRLIKDLNMAFGTLSQRVSNLNERINKITDCGHGKLKQMVTPLHQANVIGRIESLEDFRRNHSGEFHVGKDLGHIYAAKAIDELQKKVRELEDNQHKHGHTEILLRIEELEQQQHDSEALSKRIWELENNNKAYHAASMTAWNNKHEDRLIKLEQNEKLTEKTENHLGERVKELETNYEHLKIRDDVLKDDLEGLEEWQRSHEHILHACDGDKKVIDKSAWNEIREFLTHVTGQESKGLLRYDMVHSITGHPVSFDWIKKINKLVEEQDK